MTKLILKIIRQLVITTMNNKQVVKEIIYWITISFQMLLASSIILGLFYIRFLPRVSRDFWQNMTNYQFLLTLFILGCIIFNIYNTLKTIGYIETKEPSAIIKNVLNSLKKLINYIYSILADLHHLFWFILDKIITLCYKKSYMHYRILRPLVNSFTDPRFSWYYFYFLISLKMIPRVIFLSALFYDVVFCQHFHYTFRCIPLLLIPLMEQFFLFMMKDFHDNHAKNLESFLIIKPIPGTDEADYYPNPEAEYYPYNARNFEDFFYNHFYPCNVIADTIQEYEDWKHYEIPVEHVQLLLQTLRLFVYIIILIYGII